MFSSRLFWRVFGTYTALSMVGALLFVWMVSGGLRTIVIEGLRERLHDSAVVLREDLQDKFTTETNVEQRESLQNQIQDIAQQNSTRITLVTADGVVIVDSQHDSETMENHRDREELRQARISSEGVAQRNSPTLSIRMMYYALPVKENEQVVGFVRVSLPMTSVNAHVTAVQRMVWWTAILVSLAALMATYIIVGRIIHPLETLIEAAGAIAEGDLKRRVPPSGGGELDTLGNAFNTMTSQLATRIEQLNDKRHEMEENAKLLSTVFGTMVEAVVAIDRNQRMLFVNPAAETLLGLRAADVGERAIFETVRTPTISKLVQQVLDTGEAQEVELQLSRSKSIAMLVASPLPGDPPPGAVLVLHDVTTLRRLENMRRDFVSNVSHELKTPLTSIQAYADTLLNGALSDSEHNRVFVERIAKGAERLDALIQDLLSLARIESDSQSFDIQPVSVATVVDHCVRDHVTIAAGKSIQLRVEHHADGLHVLVDSGGLQTILENLVHNAINYTPQGGTVTIRCDDAGEMVRIEVSDTGIGIPEEHHARIFERFYRVDRARSREVGGTGLGLAIVKHLVHEFGGRISLTSELGKGSTFVVELPKATAE